MTKDFERLIATPKKPVGKGISLRLIKARGKEAELAIIVSDALTAEELRNAWPKIDQSRTEIRRLQGSPMNRFDNVLIYSYYEMKSRGKWSYKAIAQDINYDVLVNLVRASEESAPGFGPQRTDSYGYAYSLLKCVRMKDSDVFAWLTEGLQEISQGKAPWSVDKGPVNAERVREALRQFKRDLDSEKIVVKEPPKTRIADIAEMNEIAAKNDKFISKANSLLRRNFPKPFQTYEEYVMKKIAGSQEV